MSVVESYFYGPIARVDRIEPGFEGARKAFLPYLADGHGGFETKAGLSGRKLPLYHLDEARGAIVAREIIYVVEGEGKCDALRAALQREGSRAAVTTIAGGASAPMRPEHVTAFAGATRVVVLADSDDPGRGAARSRAQRIADAYPACDVRSVDLFPDRDDGSDVADYLAEGGTVDQILELAVIAKRIEQSPAAAGVALACATDQKKKAPALTERLKLTPLSNVFVRRVEWLEPGYIPRGKMTLTEGDGDLGKTTFIMGLLAAHSRGERFLPVDDADAKLYPVEKATVLIVAREDNESTLKARLREAGADESRIYMVESREFVDAHDAVEQEDGSIYLPRDLELLEDAIQRVGATIVYIDALHSHVSVERDAKDPQAVRQAYQQIIDLLNRTGVTLIATRHWGKSLDRAQNRGLGSSEIGHLARAVLSFAQHPEEPEQRVVTQTKKNLSQAMPTVIYRIESLAVTDDAGLHWTVPKVVITGTDAGIRPDDVALTLPVGRNGGPSGEAHTRIEDALAAIIKAFAGVDTLTAKQLEDANAGGVHTKKTWERARANLHKAGVIQWAKEDPNAPLIWSIDRSKNLSFAIKTLPSPLPESGEGRPAVAKEAAGGSAGSAGSGRDDWERYAGDVARLRAELRGEPSAQGELDV